MRRTISTLSCDTAREYAAASGVGGSVLHRQPSSFEGFFASGVFAHLDQSSFPDGVDDEEGQLGLDARVLGTSTQALNRHHPFIIDLDELLRGQGQVVEEIGPILKVAADRIVASHAADVVDSAL